MDLVNKAELVNCDYKTFDEDLKKIRRMDELGLTKAAFTAWLRIRQKKVFAKMTELKLVRITATQINEFLERKVAQYNQKVAQYNQNAEGILYAMEDEKKCYAANSLAQNISPVNTGYLNATAEIRRAQEAIRNDIPKLFARNDQFLPPLNVPVEVPKNWIMKGALDWVSTKTSLTENIKTQTISKPTCNFFSTKEGTIGQFCWTETPIALYPNIPPEYVLQKIEEHKENFDYFTVAEVNSIKDPLLLGRIFNLQDRFFLVQWGDDVKLDDII